MDNGVATSLRGCSTSCVNATTKANALVVVGNADAVLGFNGIITNHVTPLRLCAPIAVAYATAYNEFCGSVPADYKILNTYYTATCGAGLLAFALYLLTPLCMHAMKVFDHANDLEDTDEDVADTMAEREKKPNEQVQLPFDPNFTGESVEMQPEQQPEDSDGKRSAYV